MSDFFERIKQSEKAERVELAELGLKELLQTEWMKSRLNTEKTVEESIRHAVDSLIYDITKHDKEMKVCPKLEELLINISRKQIESNLPYDYDDFVGQTDKNEYLISVASIEDISVEFGSFMEDALDDFDFEDFELTQSKAVLEDFRDKLSSAMHEKPTKEEIEKRERMVREIGTLRPEDYAKRFTI